MDVDKDSGIATSAFVGHNLVEYTLTKDVTTYTEVSVAYRTVIVMERSRYFNGPIHTLLKIFGENTQHSFCICNSFASIKFM